MALHAYGFILLEFAWRFKRKKARKNGLSDREDRTGRGSWCQE